MCFGCLQLNCQKFTLWSQGGKIWEGHTVIHSDFTDIRKLLYVEVGGQRFAPCVAPSCDAAKMWLAGFTVSLCWPSP